MIYLLLNEYSDVLQKLFGISFTNLMKLLALSLSVFLLFFACENKDKAEAAEFFERANYHFKKREYDKAFDFYSEAIEKVPDFADAYHNRGIILQKRGDINEAIKEFKKAIELDGNFKQARLNLAAAYIENGDGDNAKDLLISLEKDYKDSAQFHAVKGRYLLATYQSEQAISELQLAKSLGMIDAETETNLGYAQYTMKNFDKAIEQFQAAIGLDPNFAFAYNNLSATFAQKNEWKHALENSQKAIELEPNQLLFINTHALNLLENKMLDKASGFVTQAIKLSPEDPYALRNTILYKLYSEYTGKLLTELRDLESKYPDVEYLNYYLGFFNEKAGNKTEACTYYKKGAFLKDFRSMEAAKKCSK
jgi:Flp pilus assembly protein TadD